MSPTIVAPASLCGPWYEDSYLYGALQFVAKVHAARGLPAHSLDNLLIDWPSGDDDTVDALEALRVHAGIALSGIDTNTD